MSKKSEEKIVTSDNEKVEESTAVVTVEKVESNKMEKAKTIWNKIKTPVTIVGTFILGMSIGHICEKRRNSRNDSDINDDDYIEIDENEAE